MKERLKAMGHHTDDVQSIDYITELRDLMLVTGVKRFSRRSKPPRYLILHR